MLQINSKQVHSHLSFTDLIPLLKEAFSHNYNMPKRKIYHLNESNGYNESLAVLPCWNNEIISTKLFTYFPNNHEPLKTLYSKILLFKRSTGEPIAMLDGTSITYWRTAAISALASQLLSRKDSQILLLFGTGQLAPYLIKAHLSVRDIIKVVISGRSQEKALRLIEKMKSQYPHIEFALSTNLNSEIPHADIICCATSATKPLFDGVLIAKGTHIDCLGNHLPNQRECDTETITKSTVYVDSRLNTLNEAGELLIPMREGVFTDDDIHGELSDMCTHSSSLRKNHQQITLFKSVGTALSDLITANSVYTSMNKQTMKKYIFSIIFIVLVFFTYHFNKSPLYDLPENLSSQQLYIVDSPYLQNGYLVSVIDKLNDSFSRDQNNPVKYNYLLNYLKAYSYFGEQPEAEVIHQIDKLLLNMGQNFSELTNNAELQRLYLSNVHRWFEIDDSLSWKKHFNIAQGLLALQLQESSSEAGNHALWENFITHGVVLKWLKSDAEDEDKGFFIEELPAYKQALLTLGQQAQSKDLWLTQHILWLLAKVHNFIENEGQQSLLDDKVIALVKNNSNITAGQAKLILTESYLVPSFRTKETCDEKKWSQLCHFTRIEDVLPINYRCSDNLFLVVNELSEHQLTESCDQLVSQQSHFHQLFQTQKIPVANDLNASLRVVIFDDWYQYHRYSPMLFDINTDNGGMYIEGNPEDSSNQATFFSFEAFWLRPEFKVWNLNHEYVHYLTGRFTTYGPYGHYPSHMVWWSEGIAEYISKFDENEVANKTLFETKNEELPNLLSIFETSYADGLDFTYRWSYWAVRYLAENDNNQLLTLKQHLFNNQFEAYKRLLMAIASEHELPFNNWLTEHKQNIQSTEQEKEIFPRKINRYAYPKYLSPDWLRNDGWYQHY